MSRSYSFAMPIISPLAVALVVLMAAPASAHVRLDHAEPKVGSAVKTAPAELKIWFTDDVDLAGTTIEVTDASGARADKSDVRLAEKDSSQAIVSLREQLPPGKYKVKWTALCQDGHTTRGTFRFEISPDQK